MPIDVSTELEGKYLEPRRQPAELYHFWNNYNDYYLTSLDSAITYNANEYTPAVINRSGTQHSSDLTVSEITIDVHYLSDEASEYITSAPIDQTWLTITKVFTDQSPLEGIVYFFGVIDSVSFKGQKATIKASGVEKILRNAFPKYRYQPRCNHKLFSTGCGVNAASYGITRTVTELSADGITVVVNSLNYEDNYFALGYIKPANYSERMIVEQVGRQLTLRSAIPGLAVGNSISMYPGCDKSPSTCESKYNNLGNPALDRFLGFIYIPNDNPATWIN